MRRNGRNRVTDVTVTCKGASNRGNSPLLTKVDFFTKGKGVECAPSTVTVTSVTSVPQEEARICRRRGSGRTLPASPAKSHYPATGCRPGQQGSLRQRRPTPSARSRPAPGVGPPRKLRALRCAYNSPLPTLPRVGATKHTKGRNHEQRSDSTASIRTMAECTKGLILRPLASRGPKASRRPTAATERSDLYPLHELRQHLAGRGRQRTKRLRQMSFGSGTRRSCVLDHAWHLMPSRGSVGRRPCTALVARRKDRPNSTLLDADNKLHLPEGANT